MLALEWVCGTNAQYVLCTEPPMDILYIYTVNKHIWEEGLVFLLFQKHALRRLVDRYTFSLPGTKTVENIYKESSLRRIKFSRHSSHFFIFFNRIAVHDY